MIQRIQSVWLFLAIVSVFLTMFFSTYIGIDANNNAHLINGKTNVFIVLTTTGVAVVTAISIFLFKNRKLQVRIVLLSLLLELITCYLYYFEIKKLVGSGAYTITSVLHIGVIVFLLLAVIGIRADEKIIRDSNRLR